MRQPILRAMVSLLLAVGIGWCAVDLFFEIRAFFGEHRGMEFYRDRPHLLGVCLAIAVAIGLIVKWAASRQRRCER